jgi:hypothetical protein
MSPLMSIDAADLKIDQICHCIYALQNFVRALTQAKLARKYIPIMELQTDIAAIAE